MPYREYPMLIYWSDEDDAFVGFVPDLEGCAAHGSTPEEALAELRAAMSAWLDVAQKHGDPIPEPTQRPALVPMAF